MKRNLFYHPEKNELLVGDWQKNGHYGFTARNHRIMASVKRCLNYDSLKSKGWLYVDKFIDNAWLVAREHAQQKTQELMR